MFKVGIFPVEVDALITLCATVDDCTFVSADYSSYAFGVVLNRGLNLDGGPCIGVHPYLFTKEDSVLPFDSIAFGHN